MREIEIKARITDADKTLSALQTLGVELSPPLKQHDVVYSRPGAKSGAGENWLRIRTENDSTVYFTLKRSVTGEMDSIEHEVTVDNADELESIIKYMGYVVYSDLTKIRRKAHHGELEICFDEVPELGTFIEAEKLCADDVDYDTIAAELWIFLDKLDITKADEVINGYDVMMRKLQGLEG